MLQFIYNLILDKNNKPSIGRVGFLLTVCTSIFWINLIFGMYFWNAIHQKPTPDMPSQLVMVIVTLLGGYIGAKVPEAISSFGQNVSSMGTGAKPVDDSATPGNLSTLALKEKTTEAKCSCGGDKKPL